MTDKYVGPTSVAELWAKVKQLVSAGGVVLDPSPERGSTNAVESGGVYAALSGKAASSHAHAAGDVTSGTFASARIPNLAASKITSGQLALARGGTGADGSGVPQNQVFAAPYGQDGAASFRALHSSDIPQLDATKVGIQTGTVAASSITAANGASSSVTFTPAFASAPVVIVGLTGTQTELTGACSAYAMSITATGFTLRRQNNATSARNLGAQWVAIGTFAG